jgi:methylated-DNA-[protein]-cysteine S-methyltransferase
VDSNSDDAFGGFHMSTATATTSTRHVIVDSPIGPLTLVRDDDGLTGLYYPGHWTRPDRNSFGPHVESTDDHGFDEAIAQLSEYFAGERRDFDLPLNPHGSETARQVWQLLAEIPYGQTTTYGVLAARIGGDISPRDIGGFVGHNPLSIFIACHRVVGSTGKLTGYAGGVDRKRYLLELEKAIPAAPQALW